MVTLKQFIDNLLMSCLCEFDHFAGLALKGLNMDQKLCDDTEKH